MQHCGMQHNESFATKINNAIQIKPKYIFLHLMLYTLFYFHQKPKRTSLYFNGTSIFYPYDSFMYMPHVATLYVVQLYLNYIQRAQFLSSLLFSL